MERKLAFILLLTVGVAVGIAAGVVLAQGPTVGPPNVLPPVPAPAQSPRDWVDYADLVLRVVTLLAISFGLIGTFAVLTSLRASAYGQIFGRFQGVLLKLADHPDLFDRMKKEEYTDAENDPNSPAVATNPHRFFANAIINLYEEAFLLYDSRVLSVIDPLPADYWVSMLGSMRAAFQLKYVRTHWEKRQAAFSPRFNHYVRDEIVGFVGTQPAAAVV
ncbi:MAG TPA: hypothetical protein VGJ05_10220 [Fimbriiglobus sp.]|jgi:hypothetical protein